MEKIEERIVFLTVTNVLASILSLIDVTYFKTINK